MADMTTSTATTVSSAVLSVKVVLEHGVLPRRLEARSVGYVLCSAEALVVPGHGKGLIKTGIATYPTRTGPCCTPSTISCHSYGIASHQVLHDLALSCTISHKK